MLVWWWLFWLYCRLMVAFLALLQTQFRWVMHLLKTRIFSYSSYVNTSHFFPFLYEYIYTIGLFCFVYLFLWVSLVGWLVGWSLNWTLPLWLWQTYFKSRRVYSSGFSGELLLRLSFPWSAPLCYSLKIYSQHCVAITLQVLHLYKVTHVSHSYCIFCIYHLSNFF